MMQDAQSNRKPCIALMGEFSAGKSTLANLLIGSDPLPVQVIATQLPPVCISYGALDPFCVDLEGVQSPIDLHNLQSAKLDEVAYIQLFCEEDILQQCDLMDMPGISDPNMSSEVWERMIGCADGVIWCSHATQAWRQSEAAVWADMPATLHDRSLLLLTRIDKLQTQQDRDRVVKRVRKETDGLFAAVLPISLLLATKEQDNYDLWSQSGAEDFAACLVTLLGRLNAEMAQGQDSAVDLRLPGLEAPDRPAPPPAPEQHQPSDRIVPRRVQRPGVGQPRPPLDGLR